MFGVSTTPAAIKIKASSAISILMLGLASGARV